MVRSVVGVIWCVCHCVLSKSVPGTSGSSFSFPPGFMRYIGPASAVHDNTLYIEGGKLLYSKVDGNGNARYGNFYLGSTLTIDLSTSWSNASVDISHVPKPRDFPFAQSEPVWFNPISNSLQVWGGVPPVTDTIPRYQWYYWIGDGNDPELGHPIGYSKTATLWGLSQDRDSLSWSMYNPQPNTSIRPFHSPDVAASSTHLYGLESLRSLYDTKPFTIYEFSAEQWMSVNHKIHVNLWLITENWIGPAVYTDVFGDKGVVIMLSGDFHLGSYDLKYLLVFDVATQKLFSQSTTGTIPHVFSIACVVGVEAPTEGFDLFLYGSSKSDTTVFVLSLPSFHWTEISGSATSFRDTSTCQVAGNRQMITIGGGGGNKSEYEVESSHDPWPNTIGVFDLTDWAWVGSYNASADPYERNPMLASIPDSPHSWDSESSQDVFCRPHTTCPQPYKHGTIIGGSVAAAVVFTLLLTLLYAWIRSHLRGRGAKYAQEQTTKRLPFPEEGHMLERSNEENKLQGLATITEMEVARARPLEIETWRELPTELGPDRPWEIGTDLSQGRYELTGSPVGYYLDGTPRREEYFELPASSHVQNRSTD